MEKETEAKERLDSIMQSIIDGVDINGDSVGKLFDNIFALKADHDNSPVVPDEFLCPISGNLMADPVIIASGQTYDRPSLTNWQKSGRKTSPRTNKVLTHEAIAPNHSVQALISNWCKSHGVPEPIRQSVEENPSPSDEALLTGTLKKMFYTLDPPLQKLAVKQLLRLTRERPVFQDLFAQCPGIIKEMLKILPLPGREYEINPQLHEDMIAILLNLSANDKNRAAVSHCPTTIPILIQALKAKQLEIRCNAAATIHQISFFDFYKEIIGKSDALKLLIELLKEKWNLQATRDAMNAISRLCDHKTNLGRAVRLGVVPVVAEKIMDNIFVDELLSLLRKFMVYKEACEELERLEYVPMLLSIARENPSDVNKEHAIMILQRVFENNRRLWVEMVRQVKEIRAIITQISQNGTPKAKIMANAILERLNKENVASVATSLSVTPP